MNNKITLTEAGVALQGDTFLEFLLARSPKISAEYLVVGQYGDAVLA